MAGAIHGGAQDAAKSSPTGAVLFVAAEGSVAPLFDRESLAEYLRLSTDTVDRLVKAGELPCVRIGSQVRFTLADVDASSPATGSPARWRRERRRRAGRAVAGAQAARGSPGAPADSKPGIEDVARALRRPRRGCSASGEL
jgi:excisionase family DNA binding protein